MGQVSSRLSELMKDPEPVMQQLVRVIDEGTFCPGFQFLAGGQLHPTVVDLFKRAMELKIPNNYFTVWSSNGTPSLTGGIPVRRLSRIPWVRRIRGIRGIQIRILGRPGVKS
jgi:hypothetical protein